MIVQKEIKCSHIDPATGMVECFVVNKTKNRGCWMAEDSVDQSALILDRVTRIEKKQNAFKQALAKKVKEHAEELRKKKAEDERKRIEEEKKRSDATEARKAKISEVSTSPAKSKNTTEESAVEKKQRMLFQNAIENHQKETKRLLKESAARGLPSVPPDVMNPIRMRHMAEMKAANDALRRAGAKCLQDNELTGKLQQAETVGTEMYIKEAKEEAKAKAKALPRKENKKSAANKTVTAVKGTTKPAPKQREKDIVKSQTVSQTKKKIKKKPTKSVAIKQKMKTLKKAEDDEMQVVDERLFNHQKSPPRPSSAEERNITLEQNTKQEVSKRKPRGRPGSGKGRKNIPATEEIPFSLPQGNDFHGSFGQAGRMKLTGKVAPSTLHEASFNDSYHGEDEGIHGQSAFMNDQSHRFNEFADGSLYPSSQSHPTYSLREKFNYDEASHQFLKDHQQQQSLQSQLGALGSLTGSLAFGGGLTDNQAERLVAQSADFGQPSYRSQMVDNSSSNLYGNSTEQQPSWLQSMLTSGLSDSITGDATHSQKPFASAQNAYYLSDRYDALSNAAGLNSDAQLYLQSRQTLQDVAQSSLGLSLGGTSSLEHQQFSQNLSAAQNLFGGGSYDNHQQFGSSAFSRQAADSLGYAGNSSSAYNPGGNRMGAVVSGYGDILEPNPINDVVGDGMSGNGMSSGTNSSNLQSQILQSQLMGQHQNNQGNSSFYFGDYQHF